MKQIALSLALAFMVGALPVMSSTQGNVQAAEATKAEIEAKLHNIEDRLKRAKLVVKKLKHDYLLAVKSEQGMTDAGVPEADAKHIKYEFRHKVERMIDTAVAEIDRI